MREETATRRHPWFALSAKALRLFSDFFDASRQVLLYEEDVYDDGEDDYRQVYLGSDASFMSAIGLSLITLAAIAIALAVVLSGSLAPILTVSILCVPVGLVLLMEGRPFSGFVLMFPGMLLGALVASSFVADVLLLPLTAGVKYLCDVTVQKEKPEAHQASPLYADARVAAPVIDVSAEEKIENKKEEEKTIIETMSQPTGNEVVRKPYPEEVLVEMHGQSLWMTIEEKKRIDALCDACWHGTGGACSCHSNEDRPECSIM